MRVSSFEFISITTQFVQQAADFCGILLLLTARQVMPGTVFLQFYQSCQRGPFFLGAENLGMGPNFFPQEKRGKVAFTGLYLG